MKQFKDTWTPSRWQVVGNTEFENTVVRNMVVGNMPGFYYITTTCPRSSLYSVIVCGTPMEWDS